MNLPDFRASSFNIEGEIAEFVHTMPTSRNAMSGDLRTDYARMLMEIEANESIRILILRGDGGSFCAGGDLNEMVDRMDDPTQGAPSATRRRINSTTPWLRRLLELDVIVIAAVDGPAAGAGFSLALHADFVLASEQAKFSMSFPRVGAVPDFGAHYLLPRIVGLSAARGILLTGRTIDANEAKALGIVHEIHTAETLAKEAQDLARQILLGPNDALAMSKRMLNLSFDVDYSTLSNMEALSQAVAMSTSYHRDAVMRFQNKQSPLYNWDRDRPASALNARSKSTD